MERVSEILDATLTPTKSEILTDVFGPHELIGAFRFVDPNGEVGIETMIVSQTGPLLQLPVTYRSHRISDDFEVSTMQHSELGQRYVTKTIADPVAVAEYIRVIIEGDTNAQRSDGVQPPLVIRGTGSAGADNLTIENIHLDEISGDTVTGNIDINGERKHFRLELPTELEPKPAQLALVGTDTETGVAYVLAELTI